MSTTTATAAAGDSPRRKGATTAQGVVQESGLPARLGELVLSVTGKCRLWHGERTEVARELAAHFADGLEAGAGVEELAESFGDPRQAAKLITSTRKKLRPLWWRTSRASLRAVGGVLLAMLVLYSILAARFYLVAPNVSRNIMNEMNVPVLAVPESERGWPLYIEAKKQFGPLPEFLLTSRHDEPTRPGDEGWEDLAAWLDSHAAALETVRVAASKPVMGYVLRAGIDPELGRAMELTVPGYQFEQHLEPTDENPVVVGVLLPHLGEMRQLAKRLRSDAHLAASRGDGGRFVADIRAMLGIADQMLQEQFLISDLVGIAVAEMAFMTVTSEAARDGLLSREQLRDLAHLCAGMGHGHVSIGAATEMFMVEDILQRCFSDDGNGDGHFVGGPVLAEMYADFGVMRPRGERLMRAFQPVQSVLIASRAEIMSLARGFVAAAAVDDALPPWRHHERSSDAAYVKMMHSGVYAAVPFLSSLSMYDDVGPIERACAARDLAETRRDVTLTVLAIESFRRAKGAWPRSLAELVPAYLPRVPLDPFDGRPLRYTAPGSGSAGPVLYSVGVDQVDDGGSIPGTNAERFAVRNFQWFKADPSKVIVYGVKKRTTVPKGDWVLWPELPPVAEPPLADTNSEDVQIQ